MAEGGLRRKRSAQRIVIQKPSLKKGNKSHGSVRSPSEVHDE